MKKKLGFFLMLAGVLLQLVAYGQGTHYQFRGPSNEHFRASTTVLNGFYYVVGNTMSYGTSNHILVCKFQNSGNLVWSKIIDPATAHSNLVFYATDIQGGYSTLIASDDSSGSVNPIPVGIMPVPSQNTDEYLYISGSSYNKQTGTQNMLLLKIDNNANIIWTRSDFMASDDSMVVHEEGISVESLPDGGAYIVGQAKLKSSVIAVSIARFDKAGQMRWFNRYSNTAVAANHYMARQSCIFTESDASYPTGIAITGAVAPVLSATPVKQTFIMRIDHAGNEVWRSAYPSGVTESGVQLEDEGMDIAYDPNLLAGQITDFVVAGTIGSKYMYLLRATTGGAFSNGFKVSAPVASQRLTGISLAPATTNVAVSGIYDDNTRQPYTYLMSISPVTGGISWMNAYNQTTPLGVEHITATGNGYIIAASQIGNLQDGIAITTDGGGMVNPNCPEVAISAYTTMAGSRTSLPREKTTYLRTDSLYPGKTEVSEPGDYCVFTSPPPFDCNNCLDSFKYRLCCCRNGMGKTIYTACFRFNMQRCQNRKNWKVTVHFGDGQSASFTDGDSLCHVYAQPGIYKVCYSIEGSYFNGTYWSYCISREYCQELTVIPCVGPQVLPCTSSVCMPPPVITPGWKPLQLGAATEKETEPALYPNPSKDGRAVLIFTTASSQEVDICMTDISGKQLWKHHDTYRSGSHQLFIPVLGISPGIYFIRCQTGEKYKLLKLVIE